MCMRVRFTCIYYTYIPHYQLHTHTHILADAASRSTSPDVHTAHINVFVRERRAKKHALLRCITETFNIGECVVYVSIACDFCI
jgi:hypothetical protein